MDIKELNIKGLFIIRPRKIEDIRGYFMEVYKPEDLESVGIKFNVVQENISLSKKNVFRGFHSQRYPYEQAKLVQCLDGKILDIVIDMRKDSNTYKKYEVVELNSQDRCQLFIPRGFAHGFIAMTDTATIMYKVDNPYNRDSEQTLNYLDKEINLDYKSLGIDPGRLILSEKDKQS